MAGGAHAPAEQRLRLYETLLQTTPDLVYMWDLQHRFTYANAALLAAQILAQHDAELHQRLSAWRQAQTDEVLDNPDPRGAA